jgi:CHAT domain-containing protein/tetratricopeptide (TPR) repeat protein
MNLSRCNLLLPFILLSFQFLTAQTPEKPIADMTWVELAEQWLSLVSSGKDVASLPYARAALEKARRDSSETSLDYGNSLDYLGYSLHHSGQFTEAERCFIAAVAHARQHLGENHEDYITRLSNLAMLHLDIGEVAKSASELETAVHLAEKNLGSDNPYLGIMVNNLGLAYENIGQLDKALHYYLRAMELTEQTVGTSHERYATRLHNLAAVYRKIGKAPAALDFNLRAVAIYEKTVGKNHPTYISGLNGLLSSYNDLKQYDKALDVSDEMLNLIQKIGLKESVELHDYTCTIARLYYQTGQYERCLSLCRDVLSKYPQLFPKIYTKHGNAARLAMLALEKLGRLPEAAQFAAQQNRYALDGLRASFSQLSEDEQMLQYKRYGISLHNAAMLFAIRHQDLTDLPTLGYDYQMNIKGLSLANHRQLVLSLQENSNAQLANQFAEWKDLQNYIARQYARTPARRSAGFDSLLNRSNELERNLAIGSEPFHQASKTAHWQELQAVLQPGEAAIEFGALKTELHDSTLYVAWVVRPGDAQPKQVFLFEEKTIGNLAATRRLYSVVSEEGKTLRELVWQPLAAFLKDISTIYFAPAGILHQINLGAVPISETEVMFDHFKLHRLVSTRQLTAIKSRGKPALPATALVFGGIRYETDSLALVATNAVQADENTEFNLRSNRGDVFGDGWDYLSGSLAEARDVRARLESVGSKVAFASDFDASEGYFKRKVLGSVSPTVLHLATHGFFLATPDSTAGNGFAASENPMARAGLVLSGANRVWSGGAPLAGQEDGILTALEISHLDLGQTELAVLSACGTGQGKIEAGEGVLGLQRAFKMAGVRYVIMTLWNVNDVQAQQFMGYFYDAWLGAKKTVPDAFREAQHAMRTHFSKPFQPKAWAGFVLLE